MKRSLSLIALALFVSLPTMAIETQSTNTHILPLVADNSTWFTQNFPYLISGFCLFSLTIMGIVARKHIAGFFRFMLGIYRLTPNNPLSKDQQRKILLGAITAQQQSAVLDSLPTKVPKRTRLEILEFWWEITDASSAKKGLEKLKERGQRYYFPYVVEALAQPNQEALNAYVNEVAQNEDVGDRIVEYLQNTFDAIDQLKELKIISKTEDFINTGVDAWDSSRLSFTARLCLESGYISEEEAWQYLDAADNIAHKSLTSWSEFNKSFILGRAMWIGIDTNASTLFEMGQKLVTQAKSPWTKIAFAQ